MEQLRVRGETFTLFKSQHILSAKDYNIFSSFLFFLLNSKQWIAIVWVILYLNCWEEIHKRIIYVEHLSSKSLNEANELMNDFIKFCEV